MPKTDWEAAFEDAVKECALWFGETREALGERIKAKHTHRTKDDLPEDGVYWVKIKEWNDHWGLTLWVGRRIRFLFNPDHTNLTFTKLCEQTNKRLNSGDFDLEIGPRIQPPEEES